MVPKRRILGRRDWAIVAVLTLLRVYALLLFGWFWLSDAVLWREFPGSMAAIAVLFGVVFGGNLMRWLSLPWMSRPAPVRGASPPGRVAVVTTCVPNLEPPEFLEPTLRALLALDCPHDTYLLDEGDDRRVKALCGRLGVIHFSRKRRSEYQAAAGVFASRSKHGNYNAWLDATGYRKYDFLIAFDPDHIPKPEFASATLGFFSDSEIAYVQAPQVYRNRGASWIARGAAEETYPYYSIIQMASFGFSNPILTGCHNVHRVAALREIGGFPDHTADDLLATVRYEQAGWKGVYVPEVLAAGLAPETWSAYLDQQFRWARSILDIKLRRLAGLRPLRRPAVLIAWLQGFGYLQDVFVAALGLALFCGMLASGMGSAAFIKLHSLPTLIAASVFIATGRFKQRFYLDPQREGGVPWRALLLRAGKWPRVLRAFWYVVRNRPIDYVVTPKIGTGRQRAVLVLPHGMVSLAVVTAWGAGMLRGLIHSPAVHVWSAAIVAVSLGLIVSELRALRRAGGKSG